MKEFVEKLIERWEERSKEYNSGVRLHGKPEEMLTYEAIEIANQLAEEYKAECEKVVSKLLKGEWVETQDVEKYLGIDFKLGFKLFDFSRTTEWNLPPLEGQKITTKFRLKDNNNGWIPCSERLPEENACYLVAWMDERNKPIPFYEIVEFADGDWCEDIRQVAGNYQILAWQPLPEPYQPKE